MIGSRFDRDPVAIVDMAQLTQIQPSIVYNMQHWHFPSCVVSYVDLATIVFHVVRTSK